MDLWSYLFISTIVLSGWTFVIGLDTSQTASFHGGHFNVSQYSPPTSSLSVELHFKTAHDSGIILLTTSTDAPSHYLAVALNNSQLLVLLNQGSLLNTLSLSLESTHSNWHRLLLSLHGTVLELSVDESTLTHTLQSQISYTSILLGGPESFMSVAHYSMLPVHRYFIGCMSNVTINNNDVIFDSALHQGVQSGCCIVARPLLYCFEDYLSNLSFRTSTAPLVNTADQLHVSFQLQASHTGHVFSIDLVSATTITALLSNTTLTLHLADSASNIASVDCPGNIAEGHWYNIILTFEPRALSCSINGAQSSVTLQRSISSLTLSQLTFGRPNYIPEGMTTFIGCVRRLQINNVDISLELASSTNLDDVINYNSVHWNDVQIEVNPLKVMEGESVQVTNDIIQITLPANIYTDEYASHYERQIYQAIQVQAIDGPSEGYFARGVSQFRMSDFTYYDIISLNQDEQIVYRHGGSTNLTDSALLRVFIECDGEQEIIHEALLTIQVDSRNDIPVVSRRQRMGIAMGTSRVITSDIITVSDEETKDQEQILYTVVGMTSPACGTCDRESIGRVVRTHSPLLGASLFSQAAINSGNISFQHYPLFRTAIVSINLRVFDEQGGSINTSIEVVPYEGHIKLCSVETECLFVKEGGFAVFDSTDLNATTDFQDQHPIITYDIIQDVQYGALEMWVSYPGGIRPQWITLKKNGTDRNGVMLPRSFTQDDINNGRIRYVHHNSSQLFLKYDMFSYQLRSTNLLGPTGNFCVNVVSNEILLTPDITIELQPIIVNESGSVVIDDQTLMTSVDVDAAYILDPIDTELLEKVYFLVSTPSVGVLQLNNVDLNSGDNFTGADVQGRYLKYVHSGAEVHVDSFTIYATAVITDDLLLKAPNFTSKVTANITVIPVNNHAPRLSDKLKLIEPSEGGWLTITTRHINVIDDDRPGDTLTILTRNPRANRPEEQPIGHFAFTSDPSESIRKFTMDQIKNREVIFIHVMYQSARLDYVQRLRIDDGNISHYVRPSITIQAVPLTLSIDLHLPYDDDGDGCIAHLDAIDDQPTFNLNYTFFSIMLTDHHGNDSNLVPNIKVNVSSPPTVGTLHKRTSRELITQFEVSDIRHDLIEYQLGSQRNTSHDYFTLQFRYGHSQPVSIPLTVCINPLPMPNHIHIEGVSVSHQGMERIGSTHLWVNSTRGSADLLEYRITRAPRYGVLFNPNSDESIPLLNFTQADLNNDKVAYDQTNENHGQEDSFEFRVCSRYGCSEVHTFPITIHFNDLVVINTGFSCVEGKMHCITLKEMDIFAPLNFKSRKFRILRPPIHGNISVDEIPGVQFFGIEDIETNSTCYTNDGLEYMHDSFEFNASAKSITTGEFLHSHGWVNITIIPVNDHKPEVVRHRQNLIVARGGSLTLSTQWLSAHDFDSNIRDEEVEYRIRADTPLFGYMYLDDDPGTSSGKISSWTEGQLRSGRVSYRHNEVDDPNVLDLLFFVLFDGEITSELLYSIRFEIKNVIFESCSIDEATVVEGGKTNLTISHLCYLASNDHSVTDEDLIYTITSLPNHGTLEFNSSLLDNSSQFSQADLRASHIIYTNDHSNEIEDRFEFEIEVRTQKRTTDGDRYTLKIKIKSIDDDPPYVQLLQDPAFVVELGNLTLDETILEIVDHDSKNAKAFHSIVCHVVKPFSYGLLPRLRVGGLPTPNTLDFTKYDVYNDGLKYRHTTLGHTRDDFTFNITDGVNHQNDTYTVNIVILPNEIILRVQTITVVENGYVSLKEEYFLEVQHDYLQNNNGRLVIQQDGLPQHGVFRGNNSDCTSPGRPINEFTTDEMKAGAIIYCHGGSEHSNDSFQFVYESIGPHGYDRMSNVYSVHIEVTPHNDQPPVLWKHRELSIEPWTRDTVVLDRRYLNASDGDTTDDGLFYRFTVHNDGFIAFVNAPYKHIQTFTQQDVNDGRVLYAHQFDREGYISYNVSDGTFTAHGNITISARDLSLDCQTKPLQVSFKGNVSLNSTFLECTTNDDEIMRPIKYTVENVNHGFFQVNEEQRSEFNSTELSIGLVQYSHTDVDYWEPEERLTVIASTSLADDVTLSLNIQINYPHTALSPLAVNDQVELLEGGSVCLSENVLDARNLRYSEYLKLNRAVSLTNLVITFKVMSLPSHGNILYRGHVIGSENMFMFTQDDVIAGAICYEHDDTENYDDVIPFALTLSNHSTPFHQSINISVLPVNDESPYLVTDQLQLILVEGFNKMLTQQILEVQDLDTQPVDIVYTLVSLPSNANLFKNGKPLEISSNFTQDDINQGLLELRPLKQSIGNSFFHFNASDKITTLECQFNVSVEPLMLKVKQCGVIKFEQNQHVAPITTDLLDTTTNGYRHETVFFITREPRDGTIMMNQTIVDQFKQVDIDSGWVRYVPDTSTLQYKDTFTVEVRNRDEIIPDVVINTTALVLGIVKEKTNLNFGARKMSDISMPLPADVLSLNQLQIETGSIPSIEVIDGPLYGHLEKRFSLNTQPDRSTRQANNRFTFQHNELKEGWIFYTWDSVDVMHTVNDTITVLVFARGLKPGEGIINLEVTPPIGITSAPAITSSQSSAVQSETPSSNLVTDDGFPMYVLIPIIGVILILILVIIVVVLFCLTQQNKIKKKLQPKVESSGHNHTHFPISLTTVPRPMFSPRYDFDPVGPSTIDSDNDDQHSETSSGFSESVSARQSPIHSPHVYTQVSFPQTSSRTHLSPAYNNPPVRSRIRSNVSITYSSRNSVTSDMSIEDTPEVYSHSLPRPHFQLSMPLPVRPASHTAFHDPHRGIPNMESGYNSVTIRDNCSDVVMATGTKPSEGELNDTLPVSQSKVGVASSDHMTFPKALDDDNDSLPDFGNPKLFRVTNPGPVLKKEEYWV